MTTTRSKTWSWVEDVLPFAAMFTMICLDMSLMTIVKAAMNGGMSSIVYIVYHDALGTLILLPFYIIHTFRNSARPQLTFHHLFRFFILGFLGIYLNQLFTYGGIYYGSPTMASAIGNLIPGNTFLIAVIFSQRQLEKPNLSAWVLQPDTGMIAVVWGAVYSVVFRSTVLTWCLEKKGPVFVAMFSPFSIVVAVIMDVTFLGDSLHLGSAVGATIVAAGFYTVMWGQSKEKNTSAVVMTNADEPGSYDQTTPLLSNRNESECKLVI
ncbi:EamA domain, WAT1-related protein [Tanacetum coccineum]